MSQMQENEARPTTGDIKNCLQRPAEPGDDLDPTETWSQSHGVSQGPHVETAATETDWINRRTKAVLPRT